MPRRYSKTERKQRFIARYPWCRYCGSPNELTIDHVVPLSKGGKKGAQNWQVLCLECNRLKADNIAGFTAEQLAVLEHRMRRRAAG